MKKRSIIALFSLALAACGADGNDEEIIDPIDPIDPIVTPVEPTDPVVTPVEPTDPVIVPTDPVIVPTDPVVIPTDPVVTPTDPVVTPTDPVVPVEPVLTPAEKLRKQIDDAAAFKVDAVTGKRNSEVVYDHLTTSDMVLVAGECLVIGVPNNIAAGENSIAVAVWTCTDSHVLESVTASTTAALTTACFNSMTGAEADNLVKHSSLALDEYAAGLWVVNLNAVAAGSVAVKFDFASSVGAFPSLTANVTFN